MKETFWNMSKCAFQPCSNRGDMTKVVKCSTLCTRSPRGRILAELSNQGPLSGVGGLHKRRVHSAQSAGRSDTVIARQLLSIEFASALSPFGGAKRSLKFQAFARLRRDT